MALISNILYEINYINIDLSINEETPREQKILDKNVNISTKRGRINRITPNLIEKTNRSNKLDSEHYQFQADTWRD